MIDGVLYFNTPLSQGVAVDATTGETLWIFNPKSYEEGTPSMSGPWDAARRRLLDRRRGRRAHLLGAPATATSSA